MYPPNLVSLEEEEALGDFSREMSPGSKCVSQSLLFTLSDKTVVPPFCFRGHGSSEAFTTTSLALDSKWGFAKVIWCKELSTFLSLSGKRAKKGSKKYSISEKVLSAFYIADDLTVFWSANDSGPNFYGFSP